MRALTEKNIVLNTAITFENYCTMRNLTSGICFGASINWATHLLKKAGLNKKTEDFTVLHPHIHQMRSILTINFSKFYDHSRYIHNAYLQSRCGNHFLDDRLTFIVETLNQQELFLAKNRMQSGNNNENKLIYTILSGEEVLRQLNKMFNLDTEYKNTAFLIATRVENKIAEKHRFRHCTVVINYENQIYFYDVNKGVYAIPNRDIFTCTCESILLTIARNYQLNCQYKLSRTPQHIKIKIDNIKNQELASLF